MIITTGDRVKYVSKKWGDTPANPLWGGKYGEIAGIVESMYDFPIFPYNVEWNNGKSNSYYLDDIELLPPSIVEEIDKMMDELIEEII